MTKSKSKRKNWHYTNLDPQIAKLIDKYMKEHPLEFSSRAHFIHQTLLKRLRELGFYPV